MLILQQLILLLLIQLYVLINQDFRLDSQVVNGSKLLTCPERFLGSNPSLGAKTHGVLSSYEIQYIEKYNTYSKGYNATKGGDGSILFDYNLILKLYQEGLSMIEVASKVGCCTDTVSKVIHINNVPIHKVIRGFCKEPLKVKQFSLDNEFIRQWDSIADAARWLVDNGYAKTYNGGVRQKISLCAKGKLKTAYKFIWRWK